MCCVYILRCADKRNYYGLTGNLKNRLREHQLGSVRSTKGRRPIQLIFYKEFENKELAVKYEKSLKNGKTRKEKIIKLIRDFPCSKLAEIYNSVKRL